MPTQKKLSKPITQYDHADKERANNPQVGLVTPSGDPDKSEQRRYECGSHIDPQLQRAGKAEYTSFAVLTRPLYVHECIDPRTIVEGG